jgi:hypothetical protein
LGAFFDFPKHLAFFAFSNYSDLPMPKVSFLIPASPTRGFLSQIAAFNTALSRLKWSHWQPSVLTCMGGELNTNAFEEWQPYVRDVTIIFAPSSHSENNPFHYAQIDGLFRWAPLDADVLVRMDADTLPVADFEDVLDHVVDTASIAGVMARFGFPVRSGMPSSREVWRRMADGLISVPLDFRYSYSLAEANAPEEDRTAPFYVNDGVVFFPKSLFREFAERYLNLRPKVMERLAYPYFSGQIALSLAVTEMRARTCALPMRYNFPNSERATRKFPEELENVKIFHYIHRDQFDRQLIFTEASSYQTFLNAPLAGVNKVFQQSVRRMIGPEFPFAPSSQGDSFPLDAA